MTWLLWDEKLDAKNQGCPWFTPNKKHMANDGCAREDMGEELLILEPKLPIEKLVSWFLAVLLQESYNTPRYRTPQASPPANYERNPGL